MSAISSRVGNTLAGILGVATAVAIITACTADTAAGAPPGPVMVDEGDLVHSWCAATSPGIRLFRFDRNPTIAAVSDPTCRPTH